MKNKIHTAFVLSMGGIVLFAIFYLSYYGYSYYKTPIEERFYHPQHNWFKPSGIYGQGLGIIGTAMIVFGVAIYIARKRYGFLSRFIRLKYLLEFHIFLCTLGPILVLFHTAFKFGGIVSIAFWSMSIVVLSGFIGRFIYIQIPRTIEGRELSLNEVKSLQLNLSQVFKEQFRLDDRLSEQLINFSHQKGGGRLIKKTIKKSDLPKSEKKSLLKLVNREKKLSKKIERLSLMQRLFRYWHIFHLPFAIILLIILCIHVGITVALGYKWIF